MDQLRIDVPGSLDGEFRVGNVLTDPVAPSVRLLRPDGSQYSQTAPVRLLGGVYRVSVDLSENEPKGIWLAQWSGTLNGAALTFTSPFEVIGTLDYLGSPAVDVLRVGFPGALDGEFRVGNVLTDPVAPSVRLLRPDGTTALTATPTRLYGGIYRLSVTLGLDEPSGVWRVQWSGTIAGTAVSVTSIFEVTNPGLHAAAQVLRECLAAVDGEFRVGNVLTDPVVPSVRLLRPDGSQFGTAAPQQIYTGTYRLSFLIPGGEPAGVWIAEWSGALEGVDVVVRNPFEVLERGPVTRSPTVDRVRLGAIEALAGEFRAGITLTDAVGATATLYRPDGTEFGPLALTHVRTGVYVGALQLSLDEPEGFWRVEWSGQVGLTHVLFTDVFEVIGRGDLNTAPAIQKVVPGFRSVIDGTYRAGNTISDPVSPTFTLRRPDGTLFVTSVPEQVFPGVYRFDLLLPTNEPTGYWTVEWTGTIDGVGADYIDVIEVVAEASTATTYPYGTTIDGLRAYLPYLSITAQSKPSRTQAEHFLDEIGAEVALRIGDVDTSLVAKPNVLARVLRSARHVVYLGAAALIQDATNPERSQQGGDGYATVTWQRYKDALDKLEAIVDAATPGETPGAGDDTSNYPEIESGPPQFSTFMPS